jgi:hypothetical protein
MCFVNSTELDVLKAHGPSCDVNEEKAIELTEKKKVNQEFVKMGMNDK